MTQIPSGFSMSELQNMLKNAQADPTLQSEETGDATREEIEDVVDRLITQSLEEINDPMVHKLLMVQIINNFIHWHTQMAKNAIQQNAGDESAACWYRDAGKFQAMVNILFTINCGEDDWLCYQ